MNKKQFIVENINNRKVNLTNAQKLFIDEALAGRIEELKPSNYQMINRIAKRYSFIIKRYKKNITPIKIDDILKIGISEGLRLYANDTAIINIIYDHYDFIETEDYKNIVKCINNNVNLSPALEYKIKLILEINRKE